MIVFERADNVKINELNVGSVVDAVLTTEPNWSTFYSGEFVTFRCDMNEGENSDWEYKLNKNNESYLSIKKDKNSMLALNHSGEYQCCGHRRNSAQTKCSNTVTVSVSNKVVVTRRPNRPHVFSGETITLTCEVQGGETTEWKCDWNRDGSLVNRTNSKDWMFNISESSSGNYMCRCRRRDDWFSSTQWSEAFTLSVSDPNKPSLVLQPNWSQIYRGEKVTLRCEIQGGTQWTYEWRTTNRNSPSSSEYRIN
ncbi:Fc receptor-like B [Poecilia formosa]|uniref:Fc receptor-like B n=1 Tax=Poecilia formosa TaxID=48698 RepID=UPI0007BABBCB|nr:PREDICTED: Fc receptor-like B [Poecilia formosa]